MKHIFFTVFTAIIFHLSSSAHNHGAIDDALDLYFLQTDAFLKTYVDSDGGVDYAAISSSPEDLNALVKTIATIDISHAERKEQIAFYINAYNVLVIKQLIEQKIPSSPLDDKDFFNKENILVHQQKMSLDQLEKDVLFGIQKDARFHFALVCGAKGCPPLKNFAYLPGNLENLLEDRATWAVNYPRYTRVDRVDKKVYLSQIFLWYAEDFTSSTSTLIDYLNKYLSRPIEQDYEIEFYDYDWSINTPSK